MGKKAGFEALYRLIDRMALEVFSAEKLQEITDEDISAEMLSYMPAPDVSVTVCEGVEGTRSYVLSALEMLFKTEITKENYPIVRAYVGALGFPERHRLLEALDERFSEGSMSILLRPVRSPGPRSSLPTTPTVRPTFKL